MRKPYTTPRNIEQLRANAEQRWLSFNPANYPPVKVYSKGQLRYLLHDATAPLDDLIKLTKYQQISQDEWHHLLRATLDIYGPQLNYTYEIVDSLKNLPLPVVKALFLHGLG